MSLYDTMILRVEAPRHSWKWLLGELKDKGVDCDTLDDWLKQVHLGVQMHKVGATMLELQRIREDHCECEGMIVRCSSCNVLDEITAHVPLVGEEEREASPDDAPSHYSTMEAAAWAAGYEAHRDPS